MKLLIQNGVDPTFSDDKYLTGVSEMCNDGIKHGNYNIVKLMLEHGAVLSIEFSRYDNRIPKSIEYALSCGNLNVLKLVLEYALSCGNNFLLTLGTTYGYDIIAIKYACQGWAGQRMDNENVSLEFIEFLIQNIRCVNLNECIKFAAELGFMELFELFMSNGATITMNCVIQNALLRALYVTDNNEMDCPKMLKCVFNNGISNKLNSDLLILLTRHGWIETVLFLIDGFQWDESLKYKCLQAALEDDNFEMIEVWIVNGCIDLTKSKYNDIIEIATENKCNRLTIDFLIKHGAVITPKAIECAHKKSARIEEFLINHQK